MSTNADRDMRPRGFARLLSTIRERWWAILLAIVVLGGAAYGVSLVLEPQYRATARVTYLPQDAQLAAQALSSSGAPAPPHNVSSDALVLETSAFAERVSQAMGESPTATDLRASTEAASDPQVDLIEISATGPDPGEAAKTANAYAAEFVKQRQGSIKESLTEAQSLVNARIESLSPEELASDYGVSLRRQSDDLAMLLSMQIKDYEILEEAAVPASPYFPRPFFNMLLGLAAGLVIGLILAVILDRRDKRIKDQTTLERVMDLPIIGAIPQASGKRGKAAPGGNPAVGFRQGNEALLESMRMLRSNLKVLGFGEAKRSILITSVGRAEGKSTLAVNLALTMALAGDRVVLVDADFRNPTVHQYLGIPNKEGLADVLLNQDVSWSTRIQAVDLVRFASQQIIQSRTPATGEPPVTKFVCMTTGPVPANPSEILESEAMTGMLGEFEGISDYVIVDGPSMFIASDALVLAQCVDAVVFAGMLRRDTSQEALQVRQLMDRAEITAMGIVICGGKRQSREGPGYQSVQVDRSRV